MAKNSNSTISTERRTLRSLVFCPSSLLLRPQAIGIISSALLWLLLLLLLLGLLLLLLSLSLLLGVIRIISGIVGLLCRLIATRSGLSVAWIGSVVLLVLLHSVRLFPQGWQRLRVNGNGQNVDSHSEHRPPQATPLQLGSVRLPQVEARDWQ
jgi:hypothetical protein